MNRKKLISSILFFIFILFSFTACSSKEYENLTIINTTKTPFLSYEVFSDTTQYTCSFEDGSFIEKDIETNLYVGTGKKELMIIGKDNNGNTILEDTVTINFEKNKKKKIYITESKGIYKIEKEKPE